MKIICFCFIVFIIAGMAAFAKKDKFLPATGKGYIIDDKLQEYCNFGIGMEANV